MKFTDFSDKKWFNGAIIACIGVAFFVFLTNLDTVAATVGKILGYFRPVILGVITAYVISPLANLFFYRVFQRVKNRKLRWYLSVFFSFALMLLGLFLLIGMLLPELIKSIIMFSQNFNTYSESLFRLVEKSPFNNLLDERSMEILSQNAMSAISEFVSDITENAVSIAANIGKNVLSSVIALILAVYFLIDYKRVMIGFRRFLSTVLPGKSKFVFLDFALRCDTIIMTYIAQSVLDALIIGVINAAFMAICRMPYIGLVSMIVGATNLIPTLGPAIGAVTGAFILLLVNPVHTVLFLIFCVILQSVDAYILKPRLFSGSLGVSGLSILISGIVLGNMFGILGILLSVPVTAIISFIYHDYYLAQRERRKRESGKKKEG